MNPLRNSDKLNLVDYSTFAQIKQHYGSPLNVPMRKIRNSKYKKKHKNGDDLDLMALISVSKLKNQGQKAHHMKGATRFQQTRPIKRGGKRRNKKTLTRLKKLIFKSRELRKGNEEIPSNDTLITLQRKFYRMSLPSKESDSPIDLMRNLSLRDSSPKPIKKRHSRRFREYCDNCTTKELAALTNILLSELNKFQKSAFQKNPIKAQAHRRIVLGFSEVQRYLRINKVKLVLIATDCEECKLEGGTDDVIESIKAKCKSLKVPYAFSLQRRQLAFALHNKGGIISCVGILDYDGARDTFSQLILELESARNKYEL